MKAIIEVARRGSAVGAARQQLAAARRGQSFDYRLGRHEGPAGLTYYSWYRYNMVCGM
jgi:hypothetical protein